MTENAIAATDLTRYYGEKRGVRDLNLTVPTGSILGLMGENGSGKTTALKLAMGMLWPDRGQVRTLGVEPGSMEPAVRARIGWLSDGLAVPNRMTLADAMEPRPPTSPPGARRWRGTWPDNWNCRVPRSSASSASVRSAGSC
jgi:ABC-type multidrug transport system ATPase subunit